MHSFRYFYTITDNAHRRYPCNAAFPVPHWRRNKIYLLLFFFFPSSFFPPQAHSERAQAQTAYRVVTSSLTGSGWVAAYDSGKTASNVSQNVHLDSTLAADTLFQWTVQIWDKVCVKMCTSCHQPPPPPLSVHAYVPAAPVLTPAPTPDLIF